MFQLGASDLHLCVGSPALVRKDGRIQALDPNMPALTEDYLKRLIDPIMPAANLAGVRGEARYGLRVRSAEPRQVPRQRVRRSQRARRGVPRHPVRDSDRGEARPVAAHPEPVQAEQGARAGDRSDRIGKVDDAVRDDRLHQPHARRAHHHDRRSDRVRAPEQQVPHQSARGAHAHDSFKAALRAALREDPDIVLVGELRDLETVAIAIETAETGHLVFGTLHTTTAASTVDRIIDQFPADRQSQIRIMLSESLRGVIAQTLCRKIGGGRVAALEVLIANGAVSNLIREGKTFQIPSLMQVNKAIGMVSLNDALFELVPKKLVAPDEAYSKSVDKAGFESLLKRIGIDIKAIAPQP